MSLNVTQVQYTQYHGGGNIDTWIASACRAAGVPHTNGWANGYKTLCQRESSYNPNAINTTDYNANGAAVGDGHPTKLFPWSWAVYPVDFCRPPRQRHVELHL
jgi:hypothetical protein